MFTITKSYWISVQILINMTFISYTDRKLKKTLQIFGDDPDNWLWRDDCVNGVRQSVFQKFSDNPSMSVGLPKMFGTLEHMEDTRGF